MALRRASSPALPRSRASGAPSTDAAGRATPGPATTRPIRLATAPRPVHRSSDSPPTSAPVSTPAAPRPRIARPATARPRDVPLRSTEASRRAASGATREARTAGPTAAVTVAIVPTSSPATTVPAVTTVPPAGSEPPDGVEQALEQAGHADPGHQPQRRGDEPDDEGLDHDGSPAPGGGRRPTARSSAISRVRWATRIENVL